MGYIKIRSVHVIRTWSRVPGVAVTLCGRRAAGEAVEAIGNDKSCETCLRLSEKSFRAVEQAEGRLTL